jgi:hypothetical protein
LLTSPRFDVPGMQYFICNDIRCSDILQDLELTQVLADASERYTKTIVKGAVGD